MYTVIQRSGWQSDPWKVAKTFDSKAEAEAFREEKRQADARDDFYAVEVKYHRKPLKENYDNMTVKFSDGTVAEFEL